MTFSEFKTVADAQVRYNIRHKIEKFLISQEITPPKSLIDDLEFSRQHIDIFSSEAARSEVVISPLLREIYRRHCDKFSFWIQKSIFFDNVLQGTPDYIFSWRSRLGITVLEKPILIVVEAKKNDFVQGWGQCLAELIAAQKINDNQFTVYGIVTDANLWQFGRLKADLFTQDTENYTLDKLAALYGALEQLLRMADRV